MLNQFSRTQLLIRQEGMERLFNARVAVFGIGGVGGYTVEALARSGIGTLDLIDDDRVCLTNLNRQLLATRKTVGQYKVDVAEQRIHEINPDAVVHTYKTFYAPQTAEQFDFTRYDYVVDAIDTVTGKLELAEQAQKTGTPIISSMGAGNKMDAAAFEVTDIYKTSVCPLARVMRRELKKRGVRTLKVVYGWQRSRRNTADCMQRISAARAGIWRSLWRKRCPLRSRAASVWSSPTIRLPAERISGKSGRRWP